MESSEAKTTSSAIRVKLNASYWRHSKCVPFSEDIVPSSIFLRNRHYLVLDIETPKLVDEVGGWAHIDKLGVSVACAYDSQTDQFTHYLEKDLPKLFELCKNRLVIGYNIRGFDLPVMAPYGLEIKGLDTFDLMIDIEALTRQRFLKLETVAQGTLGTGKSSDGLQAVVWWKNGEVQKVIDYCMQDVEVTRAIFEFGRQNHFIRLKRADGSNAQVPVQWN